VADNNKENGRRSDGFPSRFIAQFVLWALIAIVGGGYAWLISTVITVAKMETSLEILTRDYDKHKLDDERINQRQWELIRENGQRPR